MEETYDLRDGSDSDDSVGEDDVTVEIEPKKKPIVTKNSLTQVQMQDIQNVWLAANSRTTRIGCGVMFSFVQHSILVLPVNLHVSTCVCVSASLTTAVGCCYNYFCS